MTFTKDPMFTSTDMIYDYPTPLKSNNIILMITCPDVYSRIKSSSNVDNKQNMPDTFPSKVMKFICLDILKILQVITVHN